MQGPNGLAGPGGYAGMFGVQSCGDPGMDKHDLVQQVKAWQRRTDAHKQSWYLFCSQLGTTNYDPNRHDMTTLEKFVVAIESGEIVVDMPATFSGSAGAGNMMSPGGCGDPEEREKHVLVEKVKSFQRQGEMYKDAWYTFVHQQGTSNYDPRRHTNGTLRYFLNLADTGQLDFSASAPPPNFPGKGKGGCGKTMIQAMPVPDESSMATVTPGTKPGDWQCSQCQTINYSYRSTCTVCKAPSKGAQRVGLKPGDWICPGCGDLVFSSKGVCKMCGTLKPNEMPPAAGGMLALGGGQQQTQPQQQQWGGQQQQQQGEQQLMSQQPSGMSPASQPAPQGFVGMEGARFSPY